MDPSRLPEPVRDRLAVIGYWVCPPDLRDRVTGWDELDERDAAVADSDLRLLGSALARLRNPSGEGNQTVRLHVNSHGTARFRTSLPVTAL